MSSGAAELAWFKSSYSGGEGDSCVEVAITQQTVHVRDSKDTTHPAFTIGREQWESFLVFASGR
ncbi:DUF397 domain-containing protein [Streptomyces xinghaiensis]|uniref:DUF397 domain-containing protein n=1 Tax=Streptomyces xinghaiensis TaxID=1038928 RepID=UPI0034216A19